MGNDEDTPHALSPASPNTLDDNLIVENGGSDAVEQRERTSDEVSAELKSVQDDIARMEKEKEEIQEEINKAVADDQFGLAGQMAPKKKKLIADTAEKEQIAQRLSKELEECIERESQRQSATDIADILGDTDTLAVPEQLDDISTMDSVLESNDTTKDTGQNGIMDEITNDSGDIAATIEGKEDDAHQEPLANDVIDELSKQSDHDDPVADKDETQESDDGDMFGDMEVEPEEDTLNVD